MKSTSGKRAFTLLMFLLALIALAGLGLLIWGSLNHGMIAPRLPGLRLALVHAHG